MNASTKPNAVENRHSSRPFHSRMPAKGLGLAAVLALFSGCSADNPPATAEPLAFSGRTFGCGDWYSYTPDSSGWYVLALSRNDNGDTTSRYSIGVHDASTRPLTARIVKMSQANKAAEYFCNDVRYPDLQPVDTLEITAGQVQVTKGARASNPGGFGAPYKLNLEATGLKYRDESGEEHALPTLKADSVSVGWLAG